MMTADMEKYLGKNGWGEVKVRGRKLYFLAYADDVVLLAEEKDGMRGIMRGLEKYLREKGLGLNVRKSKVMRFRREKGREKKMERWWKEERLEEVKEFKYLEYVFQRNGGKETQVKERVRKGAAIMGQVWGIGKRRFGRDWSRRL